MTSVQVPVRWRALCCWGLANDLARVIKSALGLVTADSIQVVGRQCESKQDGGLHEPHDPEKPAAEVGEGALDGRVGGLDDLTPGHADAPGGRSECDRLPPGQFDRHGRQDPGTTVFREALFIDGQLFSPLLPEDLRDLPVPPRGASEGERLDYEAKFNQRARWRLTRHAGPDADGATRWKCPFCSGLLRSRSFPKTMRRSRTAPLVETDAAVQDPCSGRLAARARWWSTRRGGRHRCLPDGPHSRVSVSPRSMSLAMAARVLPLVRTICTT
jgi:hypothetical protein